MSKQSPSVSIPAIPDPRVQCATDRVARSLATVEMLESRKLLSAVGTDDAIYNISGTRPDTNVDSRRFPTAQNKALVPGATFASVEKSGTKVKTGPSPVVAAAEQTGEPTITALPSAPQTYSGALSGKIVYTSGGHGWQWNSGLGRYATDRPDYSEIVEDFGNQDQMTFFADYVLRAGGTVVPMRPVGRQTNEVVLDNDSPEVTYTGSWADSTNPTFAPTFYDEDYGAVADVVRYRNSSIAATETATATYTPNIPQPGLYPVYAWAAPGTNRTSQLYRIKHTGGATEIRIDHRMVGNGWVYLGTYHFNSGSSATGGAVQISNQSTAGGSVVIADAIRFGNGINDDTTVLGAPSPSNYPREDENSYHWLFRAVGQGVTASSIIGTGNVSAPSLMAEYMNQAAAAPFGTSVYIGFHSNGTTGDPNTATARGAVGLIDTDAADRTPHQADLALYTGRQINQDMQALNGTFENDWSTRTTHTFTSQFGEIDNGASAEMDATIIEVGFHDTTLDAVLLRDPKVREQLGRSVYEAALEYFDVWGGLTSPASQPRAPGNVRAISEADGDVVVSWTAPATGPAATGYKLYFSQDGYGFSNPVTLAGVGTTSHTFSAADLAAGAYYFKVAATNAGGEGPGSVVAGARKDGDGGTNRILVVNGFDRYERTQDRRYPYAYTGDGLVDRVWARYNNSFDYVVQAGEAIEAYTSPGGGAFGFDSAQNEHVINGQVDLNNYDAVIWLSGEEATAQDTFNATEQSLVTAFLNNGGSLFVSGAEIGWDLEAQGGGASFYNNALKTDYVADDANSYSTNGVAGGIFAGLAGIAFANGSTFNGGSGQFYDVDTPDRITFTASSGAKLALAYATGANGAAIQYLNSVTGSRIVNFGFPFETITTAANRNAVMDRVLDFFTTGTGVVSGRAFQDNNDNGVQDAGEPAVAGVQISIDIDNDNSFEVDEPKTTTDASGNYTFAAAPVGTYRILGGGAPGTVIRGPEHYLITVTDGGTLANQNFRYFPTIFNGTAGDDHYYVGVSSDGTRLEIHAAAAPLAIPSYSTTAGSIYELSFNLGNGDDSVTFDYTYGRPTQSDSYFNGGNNTTPAGDLYRAIGTNGDDLFTVFGGATLTKRPGELPHYFHPSGTERIHVEAGDGNDQMDFNGASPGVMTEAVTFAAGTGNNTLNIAGGTFAFPADASLESSNLTVNANGGDVTFATTQHLAALNLGAGRTATLAAGGDKLLFTRGLTIGAGAKLIMNDNDMIYDYEPGSSPEFALRDWALRARDVGDTGIFFTETIAEDMILAFGEASELSITDFDGEPIDATTVVGKYTYYGDANFDGQVTTDDYVAVDLGLGTGDSWVQGDFDLNGVVTTDDYVVVDLNLGKGVA